MWGQRPLAAAGCVTTRTRARPTSATVRPVELHAWRACNLKRVKAVSRAVRALWRCVPMRTPAPPLQPQAALQPPLARFADGPHTSAGCSRARSSRWPTTKSTTPCAKSSRPKACRAQRRISSCVGGVRRPSVSSAVRRRSSPKSRTCRRDCCQASRLSRKLLWKRCARTCFSNARSCSAKRWGARAALSSRRHHCCQASWSPSRTVPPVLSAVSVCSSSRVQSCLIPDCSTSRCRCH
mmetsp:Transcript_100191/g.323200  ORF Transcript_100191/g.323200 Transcript_100191/m.323200 type:complete len:238 (+) Transcript_100191:161-874(+)